jgi:hypothetical protein
VVPRDGPLGFELQERCKRVGSERGDAMAIPNHQIQDHASFQKVTGGPNQIAGLYYFSTLDCLVTQGGEAEFPRSKYAMRGLVLAVSA